MSETKLDCSARDWPRASKVRVFTPWSHVCYFPPSISSSIQLTMQRPEIFDEYTRRQYISKAPERNPFGVEEKPNSFKDFDVFTKVCNQRMKYGIILT